MSIKTVTTKKLVDHWKKQYRTIDPGQRIMRAYELSVAAGSDNFGLPRQAKKVLTRVTGDYSEACAVYLLSSRVSEAFVKKAAKDALRKAADDAKKDEANEPRSKRKGISRAHFFVIARIKGDRKQRAALRDSIRNNWSVQELKTYVSDNFGSNAAFRPNTLLNTIGNRLERMDVLLKEAESQDLKAAMESVKLSYRKDTLASLEMIEQRLDSIVSRLAKAKQAVECSRRHLKSIMKSATAAGQRTS